MKKKTLQAVIVALGILSASFTVSAMEKTNVENAVLENQEAEMNENAEQTEPETPLVKPEVPEEGGEEESKPGTGWIEDENGWQYKDENGNLLKDGWWEIEGGRYYFDKDGYRASYWLYIDGQYYWLGADGKMQTGWQDIWGKRYYLGPDGAMQTYWSVVDGKYYWLGSDGAMRTGWQEVWGKWYYLGKASDDGVMRTYWQEIDGKYYWLGSDGAMRTGWKEVWGKWYYLDVAGAMQTGWIWTEGDKWYYTYESGAMASNTWEKMDGQWYWFDESGLMAQGWKYIGRYKYYFDKSGYMLQDLDGILGRQSSYEITVNRKRCQVMVYAKDGSNGYIIPVKTFTCSVGLPSTPTPTGTFYTPNKYRWHTLMGPSYGQYCTRINGGILFHSVAGYNKTSYNIHARDYNKLGSPASHGCVRLNVRDAKWIYDNCSLGTKVTISDSVATPFDKPATIKIPASQNWDPTDPNI